MSLTKERLQELIEESRKKLKLQHIPTAGSSSSALKEATEVILERLDSTAESELFTWNDEQKEAITLAKGGKSFCFIGAAGTGKTTTEKAICEMLISEDIVAPLEMSTKYLQIGTPGILVTSLTRRAVRNSRRVLPLDIQGNCLTLHKVLEFKPIFYTVVDETTGEERNTMRFEPARNRSNPLPHSLKTIIIDESSMVSVDLFKQLLNALPDPAAVQFIFVGDLHQLPPVYGSAILGFKLLELPVVELKKIYRQAAKSPIISLAHKIKNGEDVPVKERTIVETEQGKVTIHPFKKPFSDFDATRIASVFLKQFIETPEKFKELYGIADPFDPEDDVILCPQEKIKNLAFGTNELNRVVAQSLGEKRKGEDGITSAPAVVWEIIAGYNKLYYAVGDRLLVGREDAIITKISRNARYWGTRPRPASIELDRWGNYKRPVKDEETGADFDVDKYLESFDLTAAPSAKDEERKQEASHLIDVELLDSGLTETLSTAGEINATQFAYCLTVHKSQGSEWNRVFFLTHQSHVVMWNRELVYTAITRARKELYIICEPDRQNKLGTLSKAARSPRIKGDTLAEKAEYFKGKQQEYLDKMDDSGEDEKAEPKAGNFKGEVAKTPPPVVPVSLKPPVKLIRLCEFVSTLFKKEAQEQLDACWARAELIWGAAKIGIKPILDYNLQRSRIIGLASFSDNKIYLNPMWCIVADDNEKIRKEMLFDTIPHEVAHFINHRFSVPKGKGHDGGWVMAAKLLGMVNPQETTSEFPYWAESWRSIVFQKQQQLEVEKDGIKADTSEDFSTLYDVEV